MLIKLGFWTPVLFFLTLKSGFPETSSQLTPSSSAESVSLPHPLSRSRTPAFRAGLRAMEGGAVGRDGDRPARWRLPATHEISTGDESGKRLGWRIRHYDERARFGP